MSDLIKIPRCNDDHTNWPCWIPTQNSDGVKLRPLIRCECGETTDISNHHIHADGRITASYYHKFPDGRGCGWHVFLQMEGWTGGEMVPQQEKINNNE